MYGEDTLSDRAEGTGTINLMHSSALYKKQQPEPFYTILPPVFNIQHCVSHEAQRGR